MLVPQLLADLSTRNSNGYCPSGKFCLTTSFPSCKECKNVVLLALTYFNVQTYTYVTSA